MGGQVFYFSLFLFIRGSFSAMSLRGVKQLKELIIRYSDYDGSSRGIREWMSNNLLNFAKNNAALQIKTELKRAKHPLLIGQYANGNTKTVCIKNLDVATIESQVAHLRNQIGRRVSVLPQSNGFSLILLFQFSLFQLFYRISPIHLSLFQFLIDGINWIQEASGE